MMIINFKMRRLALLLSILMIFSGVPNFAIDTSSPGSGSAFDDYSGNPTNEGESKAFDNDITTKWLAFKDVTATDTDYKRWIGFDYSGNSSKTVKAYTIRTVNEAGYLGRNPQSWKLEGSNNGSNWTALDTRQDVSFLTQQQQTFTVTNNTAYKYYRLYILELAGGKSQDAVQIAEIEFIDNASPSAPTVSFTAPSGYNGAWTNQNVQVVIAPITFGLNHEYQLNSGSWIPYSGNAVVFDTNTNVNFVARTLDNNKNVSNLSGAKSVKIDMDEPTFAVNMLLQTGKVVVTPNTVDTGGSGLSVNKWAYDTQNLAFFTNGGTSYTTSFDVTQNRIVTIYAKDNAGNTAITTVNVTGILDTTPPIITLTQDTASQNAAVVRATVTDANPGVDLIKYLPGTKVIADFASAGTDITTTSGFIATENGVYTVYAIDKAGNAAVRTITVSGIKGTLTYSDTDFVESSSNNGTIETVGTITLEGGSFVDVANFTTTHYSLKERLSDGSMVNANLPTGLTMRIERITPYTLEIKMTGTASAHEALNSVRRTLTFNNAAYLNIPTASNVRNNTSTLAIHFENRPSITKEANDFNEATINDGSISGEVIFKLGGATLVSGVEVGKDFVVGTHFEVSGVPTGLTAKLRKDSDQHLSLRLEGNATSHAVTNNGTVVLTLKAAAFNTGLSVQNLVHNIPVSFTDQQLLRVLEVYPNTLSTTLLGDYKDISGEISAVKTSTGRFLKWVVTARRGTTGTAVNASEFEIYSRGTKISWPAGTTVSNPNGVNLLTEAPGKLIDGLSTTKWLDSNFTPATPTTQIGISTVIFDAGLNKSFTLDAYRFMTASVSNQDPVSWELLISDDGISWTSIDERLNATVPSTATTYTSNISVSKPLYGYSVTSVSLNKLISLIDDINGLYDVVYFGRGVYSSNGTDVQHYGNDITNLTASKVKALMDSGLLTVFHESALLNGMPSANNITTKMQSNFGPYFAAQVVTPSAYPNVVKISNVNQLADTLVTKIGVVNKRPTLQMLTQPLSYKLMGADIGKNNLEFTYSVKDTEDASVTAKLYIDRNNDGLFKSNEVVETHLVNSTKTDTFYYTMPTGLTGIYFWKLVITDSKGAADEAVDVFYLKGDPITVNVLQVLPSGNLLDLSNRLNDPISSLPSNTLGSKFGEYKVNVVTTSITDFNNPPANDTKHLMDLNGNYNMVIFGFNDVYGSSDISQAAANRLKSFIDTKQSVMFTHDNIMFNTSLPTFGSNFKATVGQLASYSAGHIARNYTGSTEYSNYNLLQYKVGATDFKRYNLVSKVNSTAMTLYPFNIESVSQNNMSVAQTHYQYYKLDLENPDLIPVFNLYAADNSERVNQDAMNNYYTYSIGNITYSGTGHSGGFPDYEVQMFVNTMLKAYASSNHAPNLVVYEPLNNTKLDANATPNTFKLSFRAYDYDDGDETLSYRVLVDANNDGTFERVAVDTTSVQRGTLVELNIDKVFTDLRIFNVKVEVKDKKNASASQSFTLINTDIPKITPQISLNKSTYFVGETIQAEIQLTPSGRVIPSMDITPTVSLAIPAGVEYGGSTSAQTLNYNSIAPFSFTSTATTQSPVVVASNITMGSPSSDGTYSLTAYSNYQIDGKDVNPRPSHQQSFTVVNGQVEIKVVDTVDAGNGIKDVEIKDNGSVLGTKTNNSGSASFQNVSRGSHTYTITVPSGYVLEKVEVGPKLGTQTVGNVAVLDAANPSWTVRFTVKLDVTVPISYYHVLPNNDVRLIGIDDGKDITEKTYDLRTKKDSMVRIAALIDLPTISGNDIKALTIEMTTQDKDGNPVTSDYLASVMGPATTAWPFSTAAGNQTSVLRSTTGRLETLNTTPPGGITYAGHKYYVIIEIPKANTQKIWISKLKFTMSNGSKEDIHNSKVSIINIKDLSIPLLQ